jgi:hypothetical protein
MSPWTWFTLVLRYLGASEIFYGLREFVTAYNVHDDSYSVGAAAMAFVNHGVASCALGLIALLGAVQISAIVIPPLLPKQAEPANAEPANL